MNYPIKKYYSWDDVNNAAISIMLQMYKDNWRPDYIVGITRGGLPLAVILSQQLEIPMETLKVSLRDSYAGPESNCWMAEDAFGYVEESLRDIYKSRWDISLRKNILIVDDINDTGDTLQWIKTDWPSTCLEKETSAWDSVWHKNVRFAVMTDNLSSEFDCVDYCFDVVNKREDDRWLVYPWEKG